MSLIHVLNLYGATFCRISQSYSPMYFIFCVWFKGYPNLYRFSNNGFHFMIFHFFLSILCYFISFGFLRSHSLHGAIHCSVPSEILNMLILKPLLRFFLLLSRNLSWFHFLLPNGGPGLSGCTAVCFFVLLEEATLSVAHPHKLVNLGFFRCLFSVRKPHAGPAVRPARVPPEFEDPVSFCSPESRHVVTSACLPSVIPAHLPHQCPYHFVRHPIF